MKFKEIIKVISSPSKKIWQANVLRKLLFGYVIFNALQTLPIINLLYNPQQSLILTSSLKYFTLTTCVNLLSVEGFQNYYALFFLMQVTAAILGLFNFFPRIMTMLVFFLTLNLQNRIYSTITGGDALLCLMLFYLSFVSDGKQAKNNYWKVIQNVADNTFVFLCQAQIVILYVVSAIYKWQYSEWVDGTALQYILSIDEYSTPFIQSIAPNYSLALKFATWFSLLYQTIFPIAIFIKRIKIPILILGISFHIMIAMVMGLLNFSMVMICCYVLFFEKRQNAMFPMQTTP